MIRLAVSAEGQTEVGFVRSVLWDHLWPMRVMPYPLLLGRARSGRGGGGDVTVGRLVDDMLRLHNSFDAVTSLVDFYGFRGKGERTIGVLEDHIANEVKVRVPRARHVFPYVQAHEFEGLLFSNVTAFRALGASSKDVGALAEIRRRFPTPEDINDSRHGAPSKRIARVLRQYRKPLHGPLIAKTIGLETIRQQCPRFGAWLSRLEALAARG